MSHWAQRADVALGGRPCARLTAGEYDAIVVRVAAALRAAYCDGLRGRDHAPGLLYSPWPVDEAALAAARQALAEAHVREKEAAQRLSRAQADMEAHAAATAAAREVLAVLLAAAGRDGGAQ